MKYIEVKIDTNHRGIEVLTSLLMAMGIENLSIEDPQDFFEFMEKDHAYDWDYVSEEVQELEFQKPCITLYLNEDKEGKRSMERIHDAIQSVREQQKNGEFGSDCDFGSLETQISTVDDEDWKDKWKEYFKPAHITDRIVVKPSWESYEKQNEEEILIEIDPGMAFGTGTHPTTTLCVKLLEKYITSKEDVVLDVGCGSGILSMASALLGVKQTIGVEIDPVAVEVAQENVRRNHLQEEIKILQGDLTKGLDVCADIVVANLMADLVILLSADVAKHLKGKSIYISSGILIEKKDAVSAAIEHVGFEILEIPEEGEWCAIAARKR